MVAKFLGSALAMMLLAPSAALALGLGDIHLLSSLNAPLDAEIELIGAAPGELTTLHANVATRETFARYGLDYPPALASVTLHAMHAADGRDIIKVQSKEAIADPFLTVLVEVTWGRGHVVREYTVLLDPPVYTPGQTQASSPPVAAPVAGAGSSTREGAISRATPAAAPAPAAPETAAVSPDSHSTPVAVSRPPAPVATSEAGTRLVRRGDTLSQIAGQLSANGSAGTRSWMVAVYQANPSAFEGNMNLLHAGAVLRIPDSSAVASIAPTDALAEIHRQYAAWRNGPGAGANAAPESGRLRLVTPGESPSTGSGTSASGEVKNLKGRVQDLESQLKESQRLLDLRNAELARLQAQIGGHAAGQNGKETPPAAATPPAQTPPSANAQQPPVSTTPPTEAAPPATSPPPPPPSATTATPTPTPASAAHGSSGKSFLDTVLSLWWLLALAVAAILGMMGLRAYRSRQAVQFDDSLGRLAAAGADTMTQESLGDTANMRAKPREATFVVEESGSHERPRFGEDAAAPVPRNVPADDTISNETAINLDQGDPLAEADFHMAYGLYDQAADLIRIAISREPERRDLKLKLLEVFFVWGNKEQFLQAAHELAATRAQAAPGEWEKIIIMGKQLAPEDSLFAGGPGVSGAAAGGVDLDLEGGQSRVDFDLLGDPVAGEGDHIDLDIGSALGEESGSSQTTRATTDANLALHDFEATAEASAATTRQMTQKIEGRPTDSSEAPTVEQPGLYPEDNPTIRQKVEMALKQSGGADQTAELAIDDLGLDLGVLDTVDQPSPLSSPDAPTLVAGLDDRSRRVMEDAERRASAASENGATGAWRVRPDDMDPTLPPVSIAEFESGPHVEGDPSATSRLAALKGQELDFDLGDISGASVAANGGGSIDLDVGSITVPDTTFAETTKLSADDLALPDLEPATMSEVGTKLDLARAYMDMGDPEGARNILEEVLHEGSVAQKQEAQRLLESLPG